VRSPDTIPEIVRKAIRLARSEKPGAVLIELPEDIAKLETGETPIEPVRFRRSVPDDQVVDRAFEVIANARRPVILAGNGCIRRRASKQLRRFCDATGIGVISTFMAKGAVDVDAPYCLYTVGLGSRDRMNLAIDNADLVITLGFDMVEYHPHLWNSAGDITIVHADFEPAEIDAHYAPAVELIGDLGHLLWMLNERLADAPLSFDLAYQRRLRDEMGEDLAEHAGDNAVGLIKPQKVLWDVRQILGRDDILLSDVGAHKMWVARHYHCHEPNTCLIPNGFCSMGFALPAAISAAMVYPERRILAIVGDAGFLMNVQEMETARRLEVNLVVMVWVDNSYGLIEWKQQVEFSRHTDLHFGNPEWAQLGAAFGWTVHPCDRSEQVAETLEAAFATKGPSLMTVPIDYRENMLLTRRLGEITTPI
jgi:acetolactate synthase-1/2/3 large subunit